MMREKLAIYAHEAWSDWMKYLFKISIPNPDGTVTIPKWAVENWSRQMNTPYKNLSEKEKDADRKEADSMLLILSNCPILKG